METLRLYTFDVDGEIIPVEALDFPHEAAWFALSIVQRSMGKDANFKLPSKVVSVPTNYTHCM